MAEILCCADHSARWCWRPWSKMKPPGRRLVDDDLRTCSCPDHCDGWPVQTRSAVLRRLLISASEWSGWPRG